MMTLATRTQARGADRAATADARPTTVVRSDPGAGASRLSPVVASAARRPPMAAVVSRSPVAGLSASPESGRAVSSVEADERARGLVVRWPALVAGPAGAGPVLALPAAPAAAAAAAARAAQRCCFDLRPPAAPPVALAPPVGSPGAVATDSGS